MKTKSCPHRKNGWCLTCVDALIEKACVVPTPHNILKFDPSHTEKLVIRFSRALYKKLHEKQKTYGESWMKQWGLECVRELCRHVMKGDPVDVAAYCAFCWYHGWKTTPPLNGYGYEEKTIASADPFSPPPEKMTPEQATAIVRNEQLKKASSSDPVMVFEFYHNTLTPPPGACRLSAPTIVSQKEGTSWNEKGEKCKVWLTIVDYVQSDTKTPGRKCFETPIGTGPRIPMEGTHDQINGMVKQWK